MIFKKIKKVVQENRRFHRKQINLLQELDWANVFHDSMRGVAWFESTPLNIGRWAGNYAFFYVLNRILKDCEPKNILELGLGESSKFISKYLDNTLAESHHTIIEQNKEWENLFSTKFSLNGRSKVHLCPTAHTIVKGHKVTAYQGIENVVKDKAYDLYIIDGPTGSKRYSRYDVITITAGLKKNDEFIIIMDDTNRKGELETYHELVQSLKEKSIDVYTKRFQGNKELRLIVTAQYKFLTTV